VRDFGFRACSKGKASFWRGLCDNLVVGMVVRMTFTALLAEGADGGPVLNLNILSREQLQRLRFGRCGVFYLDDESAMT